MHDAKKLADLRCALMKSSDFGRAKSTPAMLVFSSRHGAYTLKSYQEDASEEVLNDDALWVVDIFGFEDGCLSSRYFNMTPKFYPPGEVGASFVGRPIKRLTATDGNRWVRFETSSKPGIEEVCAFQYVIAQRLFIHKKYIYPKIRFTSKMCRKDGHVYFKPYLQILDWVEHLPIDAEERSEVDDV